MRRFSILVASGLLVAGVASGCAADHGGAAPGTRSSTPPLGPIQQTPEPSPAVATAEHPGDVPVADPVVRDPAAHLMDVAVSPDNGDTRATEWETCTHHHCTWAVAVTRDGFEHSSSYFVSAYSPLQWLTSGQFVVQTDTNQLQAVDAAGFLQVLRLQAHVSPLRPGETLVALHGAKSSTFYAVDAAAHTGHRIPLPQKTGTVSWLDQRGERLWGLSDLGYAIVSSVDGGSTWRPPHSLSKHWFYGEIPSGSPHLLAVSNVGDDGVLVPSTMRRTRDDGRTWEVIRSPQLAGFTSDWMAVTPDGRLLINVPTFAGGHVTSGLYESDDTTWITYHRVADASPHPTKYFSGYEAFPVVGRDGTMTLYAFGDKTGFVSVDDGRSWQRTRSR